MEIGYYERVDGELVKIEKIPTKQELEAEIIEESKSGKSRFPHVLSAKVVDEKKMEFVCRSSLSNKIHSRQLIITQTQWNKLQEDWLLQIGVLVPEMSPENREYLLSGITPEEWENAFS